MPKAKELLQYLERQGYKEVRQSGSHRILVHSHRRMLSVPVHSGDVPRGLFLRILKDAGFTEEDFFKGKGRKR
jgi:predicted RNA binding protein YcfA (HicA-like mRNA interferase family)